MKHENCTINFIFFLKKGNLNKLKHFSIIKMKHFNIIPTEMKVRWCIGTRFVSTLIIINKAPIENLIFIQTRFQLQSYLSMFWLSIPKKIAATPTSSAKVTQENGTALLILTKGKPKTYVFSKIGGFALFLSKNALRRGKAQLLLLRLSCCKKPYYSASTGMLWNTINHSDNMILVKIKA